MPITTKVVSLNPAHSKVDLIQKYVIKFVSDLRQDSGFHQVLVKQTTTLQLKMALNTITLALTLQNKIDIL